MPLIVIGPGEFWVDQGQRPSSEAELAKSLIAPEKFLRAYERFGAHGIYVSPAAQAWLSQSRPNTSKALPPHYLPLQQAPLTRLLPWAGGNVALVFLPPASKSDPSEMSVDYQAALAAGRAAGQEAALVIAVSPWGAEIERDFVSRAEGVFHILLGGGPGYGFAASAVGADHGLLWARPEDQGRSVNVIEVLAWPSAVAHRWEKGLNYQAYIQPLSAEIPSDPAIVEIFPDLR